MSPENYQLQKLVNQGLSPAEAAEALNLPVEAATLALASTSKKQVTVEELFSKYKSEAVETLAGVMRFGESETAKVAAAKIILEGQGQMPELQTSKIREMLDKMARQSALNRAKVIDITPAPAQNGQENEVQHTTFETVDNDCLSVAI